VTVPLSVIMTVYNGEPFLRDAVECLLNQTYRDFELVVVDNGSQDASLKVLRGYEDSRLQIVELGQNIGRTAVLNVALGAARGSLVAVQDADDVSLPERLEKQVSWMSQHPNVVLLGTWCEYIDEGDNHIAYFRPPTTHQEIVDAFAAHTPFIHSSVMYRRHPIEELGGYPTDFVHGQDGALWGHVICRGLEVANLPVGLVRARLHSGQLSASAGMKLVKSWEFIRVHRQIEAQADLTPAARKLAKRTVVTYTFRHGALLCRDGCWIEGLRTIGSALACYRGLVLRDMRIGWWIVRVALVQIRERVVKKSWKALNSRIASLRASA